jgi:hypothetical protein
MIRRLPLRVRLTLWYSLVFATALFAIGLTSLWMVHRAIDSLEQNELQQRVRSVRRFLEARPAHEDPAQLRAAITADYDVSHGNKWLQVIDQNGDWIYRSPHVAAVYPTLVLPQSAPAAGSYFAYTADSIHVRAYYRTRRQLYGSNRTHPGQDPRRTVQLPHPAIAAHHLRPSFLVARRLLYEP